MHPIYPPLRCGISYTYLEGRLKSRFTVVDCEALTVEVKNVQLVLYMRLLVESFPRLSILQDEHSPR